MSVAQSLEAKLTERFGPVHLDIIDESAMHAGHAGARPEGETHFRVVVVSDVFTGESRIARQRLVHETLADDLAGPVHALSLSLHTPEEYQSI